MTYLFIMMGMPGSGKSYVSGWLGPHMRAVHLRSDDLRLAMYGADRLELHREKKYLEPMFGAMRYAAGQALAAGHSVIYDVNTNRHATRADLAALADSHDAQAIVVYISVPLAVAQQRVIARAEQGGHQLFDGVGFVERLAKNIEMPLAPERVIRLDGLRPSAEQQASFKAQLASMNARTVQ
jgi:predicted kinase